jgi:hypothetical protein
MNDPEKLIILLISARIGTGGLSDLSLSHNHLRGTIPDAFQTHDWINLDLSFNKLKGHLYSHLEVFYDNSSIARRASNESVVTLDLEVNRLSGEVPSTLLSLQNINLLSGNLFSCDLRIDKRNKQLPEHDENYKSYQCGSNKVDTPLYIWLATIGSLAIFVGWQLLRQRYKPGLESAFNKRLEKLKLWWSVFQGKHAICSFGKALTSLQKLCAKWTAVCLLVLIPIYVVFHWHYSTYENSYGWVISLAYVGGKLPALISLAIFFCAVIYLESSFTKVTNRNVFARPISVQAQQSSVMLHSVSKEIPSKSEESLYSSLISWFSSDQGKFAILKLKWSLIILGIWLLNIVIVLLFNGVYVYSVLYLKDVYLVQGITLIIILFKIVWNVIVVAKYFGDLFHKAQSIFVESAIFQHEQHTENKTFLEKDPTEANKNLEKVVVGYGKFFSRMMVWMLVFNNVMAPCLVVLVISPQCLFYILRQPPEVSVSYHFFECRGIYYSPTDGYHCLGKEYASRTTAYVPLATYSNQCVSAQLENFANIYISRYLISGIFIPFATVMIKLIHEYLFQKKVLPLVLNGITKDDLVQNIWYKIFKKFQLIMPRALRIVDVDEYLVIRRDSSLQQEEETVVVANPIFNTQEHSDSSDTIPSRMQDHSDQKLRDTVHEIFLSSKICVRREKFHNHLSGRFDNIFLIW